MVFEKSLKVQKLEGELFIRDDFSGFSREILECKEDKRTIFESDMYFILSFSIGDVFDLEIFPGCFKARYHTLYELSIFTRNHLTIINETILIECLINDMNMFDREILHTHIIVGYEDAIFTHSPFFIFE